MTEKDGRPVDDRWLFIYVGALLIRCVLLGGLMWRDFRSWIPASAVGLMLLIAGIFKLRASDRGHARWDRKWIVLPIRMCGVVAVVVCGAVAAFVGWSDAWFWYDVSSSAPTVRLGAGNTADAVGGIAISQDARWIAAGRQSADSSWKLILWDSSRQGAVVRSDVPWGSALRLAFAHDGMLMATIEVSKRGRIAIWRLPDLYLLSEFRRPGAKCLAFSPDGYSFWIGCTDGTIRSYKLPSLEQTTVLRGHSGGVSTIVFAADGNQLLSGGSADGTVRAWNVIDGKSILTFRGHRSLVSAVAISRDGRRAGSGDIHGTVNLWDLSGRKLIRSYRDPEWMVWSLGFSPSGNVLIAGGDKTLFGISLAIGRRDLVSWYNVSHVIAWDLNSKEIVKWSNVDTRLRKINVSPLGEVSAVLAGDDKSIYYCRMPLLESGM